MTFAHDDDALAADVRRAVEEVIAKHGGFAGHFMLLAEVAEIDNNGMTDSGFWTISSANIRAHETYGLLRTALAMQDAAMIREELDAG